MQAGADVHSGGRREGKVELHRRRRVHHVGHATQLPKHLGTDAKPLMFDVSVNHGHVLRPSVRQVGEARRRRHLAAKSLVGP